MFDSKAKIISTIDGLSKAPASQKCILAEGAIKKLGSFDLSLWTDGSVQENGHGGSACISYSPHGVPNPYKRRRLSYRLPICITKPAGRICCPADAKILAVKSAFEYITDHQSELTGKRLFVGIDAQSILRALEVGPHRPYSYLGVDSSPQWMSIRKITRFCKELVLHHVPAHVGLVGNELADERAQFAASTYTVQKQDQVCASLSNLKSYLRTRTLDLWIETTNDALRLGFRQTTLQNTSSKLKLRTDSPRPLQTLYSRYQCDRAEVAGTYPWRLNYINNPACRFCGCSRETLLHLFEDCFGTRSYRDQHSLNSQTLASETPAALLKVAEFDSWIRRTLPFNARPPSYRVQAALNQMKEERKRNREDENDAYKRPIKRNRLVIPDSSLDNSAIHSAKIRRVA